MIGDLFLCYCSVLFQETDEDKSSVAKNDDVFVQFFLFKKNTVHIPVNLGLREPDSDRACGGATPPAAAPLPQPPCRSPPVAAPLSQPPLQVWGAVCVKNIAIS